MRTILFILLLGFLLSLNSIALASGRSSAGGGDLEKFDTGRWAMNTGIGMASSAIGGAIGNGIKTGDFSGSFANMGKFSTWSNTYSSSLAAGQVSRAIGTAGAYYGWDPKLTVGLSTFGSCVTSGGLNPGQFGANGATGANIVTNSFDGMKLGAINGLVQGGIMYGLTDVKKNKTTGAETAKIPTWAGAVAGLAGGFTTGYITSGYTASSPNFSFNNNFNSGTAFTQAWKQTAINAPSFALQAGIENIAKHNKANADTIRQASSGLYPVVGSISNYKVIGPLVNDGKIQQPVTPGTFHLPQNSGPNVNTQIVIPQIPQNINQNN